MAMRKFMQRFIQEEEGATAVEYAVMLVLIIVVAIVVIQTLGKKVNNAFQSVSNKMPS